ncbi:MAG: hypothetical protein K5682_03895, partial [Lachnospiraceae bacterium]|nr:hypothetical protein [Lachnospiraceae bacterium]
EGQILHIHMNVTHSFFSVFDRSSLLLLPIRSKTADFKELFHKACASDVLYCKTYASAEDPARHIF